MTKPNAIAIAVALGAIALIWAVLFVRDSGKHEAAPPPALPAPVPEPEAQAEDAAAPSDAAGLSGPAPAASAPAAAPTPGAPPERVRPTAEQLQREARPEQMGPVERLKAAYESDARDRDAGETEQRIRKQLTQDEIPATLVRRVSCVKTVCKIELNWRQGDGHAYMIALMNLVSQVSQELAAEPLGNDEGQAMYPIDVYVSRVVPPYATQQPE